MLSAMPLSKIRVASVEELEKIRGIGRGDAERVYEYFRALRERKGGKVK